MHPAEIPVCFRTPSGNIIPSHDFDGLVKETFKLGPQYRYVLDEQVSRQHRELSAATA